MEIIVLHRERRLRHGQRGDDGLASNCYLIFANLMQAGEGTSSTWPVGVRWPVCGSILKITMLLEFWLAATRKKPPGAFSKLGGFLHPLGTPSKNLAGLAARPIRRTA